MSQTYDEPELVLDDEAVMFRGRPVGVLDGERLVVNAGWCRLAGLSLTVEDDPKQDRHRDGLAFERTYPPRPITTGDGAAPA